MNEEFSFMNEKIKEKPFYKKITNLTNKKWQTNKSMLLYTTKKEGNMMDSVISLEITSKDDLKVSMRASYKLYKTETKKEKGETKKWTTDLKLIFKEYQILLTL